MQNDEKQEIKDDFNEVTADQSLPEADSDDQSDQMSAQAESDDQPDEPQTEADNQTNEPQADPDDQPTEPQTDQPSPQADPDDQPNQPQLDLPDDNQDPEITTQSVIEAVLFASDEPITPRKLADIVGAGGVKEVKDHIDQLNLKYEQTKAAFRIDSIAGGFQMLTQSKFSPWLRKLISVRSETKLSPAALETLAIIAYKQPIMRVDIENIRGVAAGEMTRQLIDKGLVKIAGRAEELGRPLLYGTTKKFLEIFGLNNLKDLPTAEDLKKPE